MKLFRHILSVVCVVASFVAIAGEPVTAKANGPAKQPAAVELQLQLLQGTWEGVAVGQQGKITITVTGHSFHFQRDTNFWFETTITLPAGADPKQLHATIKDCPTASSIGKVVGAIYKIEDGTLTLADYAIPGGPPKTFADAPSSRYLLKKVQPQPEKKNAEALGRQL